MRDNIGKAIEGLTRALELLDACGGGTGRVPGAKAIIEGCIGDLREAAAGNRREQAEATVNCRCIEKAEKKLAEATGDPEARIVTGFRVVAKNGTNSAETYIPIQCIFRKKKKDGTFGPRNKNRHLMGAHCPFCGKAID